MNQDGTGKLTRKGGFTPLMYAAQAGNIRIVDALLDARAKVNAKDETGTRPVHLAASSGELLVLDALIRAGANIGVVDDDHKGVLDYLPEEFQSAPAEKRKWCKKIGVAIGQHLANHSEKNMAKDN